MRKILTIIIYFISLQCVISQEYKAFDGTVFKVGDTIAIGNPTGYKSYKYLKSFDSKSSTGYKPSLISFVQGKKYVIKKFHVNEPQFNKAFYSNNSIILEYGTKGILGISMYAELNKAIQSGEIVLKYTPKKHIKRNKLSDTSAFAYYLKSSKNSSTKLNEEYLYRFLPSIYRQSKNDEFEYQKSLNLAKNKIENIIQKVDTTIEYVIYTKLRIGNYDFEKHGFPIDENDYNLVIIKPVSKINANSKSDYLPIAALFKNFDMFRFLKMNDNDASRLIKRKKDKYGNIDRHLFTKIVYRIVINNYDAYIKNLPNQYRYIVCEIKCIEFFEFNNFNYNWLGEINY